MNKAIEDLTIKELISICPVVKCGQVAQCPSICALKPICFGLPYEQKFVDALCDRIEDEGSYCLRSKSEYYDSHNLIFDHVDNLTINIQGENYGSN